MTWGELFDCAANGGVTEADVQEVLAKYRDRQVANDDGLRDDR